MVDGGLKITLTAVCGIAVVALLAVGCGGGDSSTDAGSGSTSSVAGSSSLSKAAFIKKASAICAREREDGFEKVSAYEKKYRSEGLSGDALLRAATRAALIGIVEAEVAALRALAPPDGDEGEFEAVLDEVQKAVDNANEKKTKTGTEVAEYLGGADKELRAYGLGNCTKES